MLDEFDFGVLQAYIDDDMITDINYNGKQCWIDHLQKGRYALHQFDAHEAMQSLVHKLANYVNLPFNISHPVLEAETNQLRISLLHPSISRSGLSLSIRKTPMVCRLHDEHTGIKHYGPAWLIQFLRDCIAMKKNVMISGLPGSGKTELVKYLMESIPASTRVITIEDSLELRYGDIHPEKDHVMMKVNDQFSYAQAIKTSLRQRPDWICVSEVRGKEIRYLLQSCSTGTSLISTIHAHRAKAIPQRMKMMMIDTDYESQNSDQLIHDAIQIGVHLHIERNTDGIVRYISEVVAFKLSDSFECIKEDIYLHGKRNKALKAASYFSA